MEFATFDPLTASNDELILWCGEARFIHRGECFRGVVQPASTVVIKIGSDVTEEEARNQTYAYEQLKGTDLQVPQVYRYFSRGEGPFQKGYLMMEYIPGRTMEKCMTDDGRDEVHQIYAQHICRAANTLSKIAVPPLQPPGPVGGGKPCGYLFQDGYRAEFELIQQMNDWLNERLLLTQDPSSKIHKCIDIHEQARTGNLTFQNAISMVHGDLAPRNFIIKDDGTLALLDWDSAGFYPKVFEFFCCRVRGN
jgi:serine/threonine protein kinase